MEMIASLWKDVMRPGSNVWDKKLGRRNASVSVEACNIRQR